MDLQCDVCKIKRAQYRCGQCLFALYCSDACQDIDLIEKHHLNKCVKKKSRNVLVSILRVIDGDTVKVRTIYGNELTVRLRWIDAPEKNQDHGPEATKALSEMLAPFPLVSLLYNPKAKKTYGRTVGSLYIPRPGDEGPGLDVQLEMVIKGHAWAYPAYNPPHSYINAQEIAKTQGFGLWAPTSQPIAPWDWRRSKGKSGYGK